MDTKPSAKTHRPVKARTVETYSTTLLKDYLSFSSDFDIFDRAQRFLRLLPEMKLKDPLGCPAVREGGCAGVAFDGYETSFHMSGRPRQL